MKEVQVIMQGGDPAWEGDCFGGWVEEYQAIMVYWLPVSI